MNNFLCENDRYFQSKRFVKKKTQNKKVEYFNDKFIARQEDQDYTREVSGIFHDQKEFANDMSD
ncbi:hypothetical protein B6A27_05875 [Anoxybacillus sp. UARK-01]|nr:hypothetical protein B6A27_05875 [Anoxybacillus sp. UARK-01]